RLTCGYVEQRGRGRLVVLGVSPTPELILALHGYLGVTVPCRLLASAGRVHSALFQRGDEYFAIVTNTGPEVRDVVLTLDLERPERTGRGLRSGVESRIADGQ